MKEESIEDGTIAQDTPEAVAAAQVIRMDELEIKVSFLEKELEEYKEASRTFHRRMSELEAEMVKLTKEIPQSSLPVPEATWDVENHQVRN